MYVFAQTAAESWRPGIGDPTFAGWLTVVLYLLASVLCYRRVGTAKRLEAKSGPGAQQFFWFLLALAMFFLAINKQLDLQTLLTEIGRDVADSQGWYEDRRPIQRLFVFGVAVTGGVALIGVLWWQRRFWRSQWLTSLGLVSLLTFVLIRASSFHHVDAFLGSSLGGLRMNWIFEIGGILCIIVGSLISQDPPRQPQPRLNVLR